MLLVYSTFIEVLNVESSPTLKAVTALTSQKIDPLKYDMLVDATFNETGYDGLIAVKTLGAKVIKFLNFDLEE